MVVKGDQQTSDVDGKTSNGEGDKNKTDFFGKSINDEKFDYFSF